MNRASDLAALVLSVAAIAACTGVSSPASSNGSSGGGPVGGGGGGGPAGWLHIAGTPGDVNDPPRIKLSDGRNFHGQGVNIPDSRGCGSCTYSDHTASTAEVNRRLDYAVDNLHVNFIRLLMEVYAPAHSPGGGNWGMASGSPTVGSGGQTYIDDLRTILNHAASRGVYVLLTLIQNDVDVFTTSPVAGWPAQGALDEWKALAAGLRDIPNVMYGIANEPEDNWVSPPAGGSFYDPQVWTAYNDVVQAIRDIEDLDYDPSTRPYHIVVVQGTGGWAKFLGYYAGCLGGTTCNPASAHPITAGTKDVGNKQVAYETHSYDDQSIDSSSGLHWYDEAFGIVQPYLPVILGEFAVSNINPPGIVSQADVTELLRQARQYQIPHAAWILHQNCAYGIANASLNLISDTNTGTTDAPCGIGMSLQPSGYFSFLASQYANSWRSP